MENDTELCTDCGGVLERHCRHECPSGVMTEEEFFAQAGKHKLEKKCKQNTPTSGPQS